MAIWRDLAGVRQRKYTHPLDLTGVDAPQGYKGACSQGAGACGSQRAAESFPYFTG